MKLILISSGLFLLSYLIVNRGLGPQPLQLIAPLLAVVGTAAAARWLMRRSRGRKGEGTVSTDVPVRPQPLVPPVGGNSSPGPRAAPPVSGGPVSGGKARKLF